MQPRYPNVRVQLSGKDGNAFSILGAIVRDLRKAGVPEDEVDAFTADAMSGDYANLLRTAMAWVEVS